MASEIVEHDGTSRELAHHTGESANLLSSIVAAARDPAVDAGKMEAMANLALKLQAHEQEQQFNRDLNAALIAMPVITKAGRIEIPAKDGNPARVQGHFARFEDLNAVVKPLLAENNLAITFDLGSDERGVPNCIPILRHTNGWVWTGRALSAPIDSSGSKNNTQGVGSTTSYLKRYTMCAALNIVVESEDDDANGGQILMPNERGNLIIEAATAAFDDGNYTSWFATQSPKDRAWLIQSGKHAEYGGPALPAPEKRPEQAAGAPATHEKAEQAKATDDERRRNWVASYCNKARACRNTGELDALKAEQRDTLDKLRDGYPDLWREIAGAHAAVREPATGRGEGLFEGDEG